MRKTFIYLTVLIAACSVPRGSTQPSVGKVFVPLSSNETITYTRARDGSGWALVLSATNSKSKASHEILRLARFDRGNVSVVENGKKAYFVILSEDPDGISDLWVADGVSGKAYPLFKSASSFAVSPDGRFACYEDLVAEMTDGSGFPVATLYDLHSKKATKTERFADEPFRNTVAKITFDPDLNVFRIVFVAEERVVGTRVVQVL
jgi:hypothetical protein